jgi:undecaprenyl-diphosphatase
MRSPNNELTLGQALALGALQGPAELLPISSSAHTTAVPWLLGWRYTELGPEQRKTFEVVVHGGGALALVLALRGELERAARQLDRRRLLMLGLACAPPAIAGYALQHQIERHLGTPRTIAAGLLAGAVVMAAADCFPQKRGWREAGAGDGLWLGLAQACALVPGVSRTGATLAVARIRGFRAADARLLSDEVALPVLAGATLLEAVGLRRRGLDRPTAGRFAAGAAGAFVSTLLCAPLSRRRAWPTRLAPYAAYRAALASWMLIRLRRGSTARHRGRART